MRIFPRGRSRKASGLGAVLACLKPATEVLSVPGYIDDGLSWFYIISNIAAAMSTLDWFLIVGGCCLAAYAAEVETWPRRLRDRLYRKHASEIPGARTNKFKLYEAACLLVDEEPQWPPPSMRSREEYDGLIKAVESDKLMYLTDDYEGNQKPINELHDDSETRLTQIGIFIHLYENDGGDFFQTIEVDRKSLREYLQSQSSTIPGFLNEDFDDS